MADLLEIIQKIQDTEAAIAISEQAIARNPNSPTLVISMESILKRRRELEEEFSAVTAEKES